MNDITTQSTNAPEDSDFDKAQKLLKEASETVKILQAKVTEVSQALAGYGAASASQQNELDEAKKVSGDKLKAASDEVKDVKQQIDNTITKIKDAVKAAETKKNEAQAESKRAAEALQNATTDVQSKQKTYDDDRKLPTDIVATLKDIKSLLEQVSKAELQSDFVAMYYLSKEANGIACALKIPSEEDYKKLLWKHKQALEDAKTCLDKSKEYVTHTAERLADATKIYEQAVKSERTDILGELKLIRRGPC